MWTQLSAQGMETSSSLSLLELSPAPKALSVPDVGKKTSPGQLLPCRMG